MFAQKFISIFAEPIPLYVPTQITFYELGENGCYSRREYNGKIYYKFTKREDYARCLRMNKLIIKEFQCFNKVNVAMYVYENLPEPDKNMIAFRSLENYSVLDDVLEKEWFNKEKVFKHTLKRIKKLHDLNIVYGNLSYYTVCVHKNGNKVMLGDSFYLGIHDQDKNNCLKKSVFYPNEHVFENMNKYMDIYGLGVLYLYMWHPEHYENVKNLKEMLENPLVSEIPDIIRKCLIDKTVTVEMILQDLFKM